MAIQLFSQMRAAGLPPTLVTYNALLAVLSAGGQWQRALRLFHHLETQSSEKSPSAAPPQQQQRWITYCTTIEALAGAAQWPTAAALLRRATAEGLTDHLQWRLDARIDLHALTELGAELVVRCWLAHLREEAGRGMRVNSTHVWIVTGRLRRAMANAVRIVRGGGVKACFVVVSRVLRRRQQPLLVMFF